MTMKLGNQEITASYDEWEELYDNLEKFFGEEAVEISTEDIPKPVSD